VNATEDTEEENMSTAPISFTAMVAGDDMIGIKDFVDASMKDRIAAAFGEPEAVAEGKECDDEDEESDTDKVRDKSDDADDKDDDKKEDPLAEFFG
jgi:hypothetical protein